MKKLIFFAFLIGMTSCGTSQSGKRSAEKKAEMIQPNTGMLNPYSVYNFYVNADNVLAEIEMTVEQYNAMKSMNMDSIAVFRPFPREKFLLTKANFGNRETAEAIYLNISTSQITAIKR